MAAFECLVVSNKSGDSVSPRSCLIPQMVVASAICFGCGLPSELRARQRVFPGSGEDSQTLKRRCVSIAEHGVGLADKKPAFKHEQ